MQRLHIKTWLLQTKPRFFKKGGKCLEKGTTEVWHPWFICCLAAATKHPKEQLEEQSIHIVSQFWLTVCHGVEGTAVDSQCDWSHWLHCTQSGSREMNSYTQLSFCFSFFLVLQSRIMTPKFRVGVLHLHPEMYLLGVSKSSQKCKITTLTVNPGEIILGVALLFPWSLLEGKLNRLLSKLSKKIKFAPMKCH